mgnify:CR=1 FL=1
MTISSQNHTPKIMKTSRTLVKVALTIKIGSNKRMIYNRINQTLKLLWALSKIWGKVWTTFSREIHSNNRLVINTLRTRKMGISSRLLIKISQITTSKVRIYNSSSNRVTEMKLRPHLLQIQMIRECNLMDSLNNIKGPDHRQIIRAMSAGNSTLPLRNLRVWRQW